MDERSVFWVFVKSFLLISGQYLVKVRLWEVVSGSNTKKSTSKEVCLRVSSACTKLASRYTVGQVW